MNSKDDPGIHRRIDKCHGHFVFTTSHLVPNLPVILTESRAIFVFGSKLDSTTSGSPRMVLKMWHLFETGQLHEQKVEMSLNLKQ